MSPPTPDPESKLWRKTGSAGVRRSAPRSPITQSTAVGQPLTARRSPQADRSSGCMIWVYERKRSGALKARLCVQGCA
eukprot:886604-Pleurochrysis_carterae.AAC.1